MSDNQSQGSVSTGSSADDLMKAGPDVNVGAGQPAGQQANNDANKINLEDYVPKDQFNNLEKKLGIQGDELGKLRNFFEEVSPLLEKFQGQPEFIQAIIDGKVDANLAKAALEGKIKIEDAQVVSQAHEEVKEKLGQQGYANASKEDIEKMVMETVDKRLKETEKKLNANISEVEERREFENKVNGFIQSTKDFPEYAEGISKWFEEHPDQYDIEIAYQAVKGRVLSEKASKDASVQAAEAAKNIAANAGGGQSQGGKIMTDPNVVDKLIGRMSNPNTF